MIQALDYHLRLLFHWFTQDGATRSTALLVFITGWYAVLTYLMSRSMTRQTRAMVQPALNVQVRLNDQEPLPKGSFLIKNMATQPALLLNIEISCSMNGKHAADNYVLWDEHILPPGGELEPLFDFTRSFERQGVRLFDSGFYGYYLGVTASDLSKTVVLTYSHLPVLGVANVKIGLPWKIRWRYLKRNAHWRWLRLKRKYKRVRSTK